jgi:DNA replication protein DnaC
MNKKDWIGGCWAESYCKGFPSKCGWDCIGWHQLNNIYALSHMPKRYQRELILNLDAPDSQQDKMAYVFLRDWMQDVERNIKEGNGLYIMSQNRGNGKTSWACKIMNEHFKNVALRNDLRCRGIFINVPSFLQDMRQAMDSEEHREEANQKIESIMNADLVIWDDIGTEVPSNWVRERLYSFINHRYSNNLSQIFTSNIMLEDLAHEKFMGERIASRIIGQCQIVEFKQRDRRID